MRPVAGLAQAIVMTAVQQRTTPKSAELALENEAVKPAGA
jgi:hypothetical protein